MNLVIAVAVAVLFGSGAFLILKTDLFRVVIGITLIANAANLTLMASALSRGRAPIAPLERSEPVSDPLVQAMTLTALVLGFAITALLLVVVVTVHRTHATVDLDELAHQEARREESLEREEVSV